MTHAIETPELLSPPSEKFSTQQYADKLHAVEELTRNPDEAGSVGAIPHSTRELNMMAALAHPIYVEDGVPDYVDEVVTQDPQESPLAVAEEIIGFYRDALINIHDVASLVEDFKQSGRIQPRNAAMFAAVQRHEDTVNFMKMPELLDLYIDDDYSQMPNAKYADLLMGQKDQEHIYKAFKEVLASEKSRAAFWLKQIAGSEDEIDGEQVTRKGLIDSRSPDVQAYIAEIAGIRKPALDEREITDFIFSIGKRPKLGDTTGWEKFKHRNRLNDVFMLHTFLPQSNKEAYKIKRFDYLKNDPAAILKWMDMINESNRRWEVAKDKDVNPKERLNALVGRFDEYADDAAQNAEHAEFVLNAIDEKSDDTALFADSFPSDEWFRDYPEHRLPFVKLAEFLQTEEFIKNGRLDNITKKARAKKEPTEQDEIDLIMNKLGKLPLSKVAEIADRYQMDQTNRFAYWEKILKLTRRHKIVTSLVDQTLSRLSGVAPRYIDPDNPHLAVRPTMEFEQPF